MPQVASSSRRRSRATGWCCVAAIAWLVAAAPAWAEQPAGQVVLLPFDTAAALEIYGQPVASEIARALVAGGLDVVVVGARMAVPDRAALIVDGTIASGKGGAVVLGIRLRNAVDGVVISTMQATAESLATIDKAAAELSGRVLPAVKQQLVALRPPPSTDPGRTRPVAPPPSTKRRPVLVAVSATNASTDRLRRVLSDAVDAWALAHHRVPTPTEPAMLSAALAATTVKASGNDLAVAFEIVGLTMDRGTVPVARARVRVRISDAVGVVFDRVIVTDSVVGDRAMSPEALAGRVAREVVDIVRPHVKRSVVGWR